jgi:hypothetical protein
MRLWAPLFLVSAVAPAATTYQYTGQVFTTVTPPYTTSEKVTGSFVVATPLPHFMPSTTVTSSLVSFSFTDGVQTRTETSSVVCDFRVATDGVGNITQWSIYLTEAPHPATGNPEQTMTLASVSSDVVGTGNAVANACASISQPISASSSGAGSWSAPLPPGTPTTYSYLGQLFTSVTPPYTTSERVTGSIKVGNPLPPVMPMTDITAALIDFSFTDGVQTRTPANSVICGFLVATDAVGNITQWSIYLTEAPHPAVGNPEQTMTLGSGFDAVGSGTAVVNSCASISQPIFANSSGPGTWSAPLPPGTPTTYNYLGRLFSSVTSPYSISERVTGLIKLANPLPPFMPMTDITPALIDFSFADGVQTRTPGNSVNCGFQVATDGAGNITKWSIYLTESPHPAAGNPEQTLTTASSFDVVGTGTATANACDPISQPIFASSNAPGTWNGGLPPAPTITYPYSGPLFVTVVSPYTTSLHVTGTILLGGALPPNTPLRDVTAALRGFTYSDGIQTRTLADSVICNFQLGTDSAGQIVEWNIMVRQKVANNTDPFQSIDSIHFGQAGSDIGGTNPSGGNPCGIFSLNPFGSTGLGNPGSFGSGPSAPSSVIPTLSLRLLILLAALLAASGYLLLRLPAR